MMMPKVNGFCCLGLESTGKVLGWLGLIGGLIGSIVTTALTIFICSFPCDNASFKFYMKLEGVLEIIKEFSTEHCSLMKYVLVSSAVLFIFSTFVNGFLLKGIRTQNASKILPAVYLQGYQALSVVAVLLHTSTVDELIVAVIIGAIEIYIFIILFSLYVKVKDQFQTRQFINSFNV